MSRKIIHCQGEMNKLGMLSAKLLRNKGVQVYNNKVNGFVSESEYSCNGLSRKECKDGFNFKN